MMWSMEERMISDSEINKYLIKRSLRNALRVGSKLGTFVWTKKIQSHVVSSGRLLDVSLGAEKKRKRERMAEIEKIKKTRVERAVKRAKKQEEMGFLARNRAGIEFEEKKKKEAEFEIDQSRLRSEIRLREGRTKPIDLLLLLSEDDDDDDPCSVLNGLKVEEMEELCDEVRSQLALNRAASSSRIRFWEAMLLVCDWELGRRRDGNRERGVRSCVLADLECDLERRTLGELESMQLGIESMMRSGRARVVEFWEDSLERLQFYKAKAFLREVHANPSRKLPLNRRQAEKRKNGEAKAREGDNEKFMESMEEGDAVLGPCAEVNVDSQSYWWHDKYAPRKPKYMNLVRTAYSWNRYNRVHYDHDNPPPRSVQGYKFSVFYPDLIDTSKTPTYTLEKDEGGDGETCIIRFHGGPPYKDIAFRIVNREWETSRKKGFKSTFDRGILQLHFYFKQYRYRR